FAADHEAGNVLQEYQRDLALAAKLDEMRRLQRRLGEENAVVGDDPDRITPDAGETADQGLAIERLELVQLAAVDDARDHLAYVAALTKGGPPRKIVPWPLTMIDSSDIAGT